MRRSKLLSEVASVVLLSLAVLCNGGGWQPAIAQQPPSIPPAAEGLQPFQTPGAEGAPGAPEAPMGLTGRLVPFGPSPEVALDLQWQPVAGATCIGIERQTPPSGRWETGPAAPGDAVASNNILVGQPGQNCFRVFAANQDGRSGYSNVTCVDVPGAQVTFPAGWNLISVPDGATILTGADGPLYSWDALRSTYTAVPADTVLDGGNYWAYFDMPTTETFPVGPTVQSLLTVPAGQWMLIGNPRAYRQETVDLVRDNGVPTIAEVYVYDPDTGAYNQTTTLEPGQAAWVYSPTGGLIGLG